MKDNALMHHIKRDPERGMEELIRTYSGLVRSVVSGRLSARGFCEADIDACTADTFSDFYMGLDKYDPERASVKTWLCVIAKNNATDAIRKRSRESKVVPLDEAVETTVPDDFSLEGSFEDKQQREELIAAIIALGSPDREILIMKFFLGLTSKNIAEELHLSVSNVDTRTHRAIAKLRERFGGNRNE